VRKHFFGVRKHAVGVENKFSGPRDLFECLRKAFVVSGGICQCANIYFGAPENIFGRANIYLIVVPKKSALSILGMPVCRDWINIM
jgi:hypothetical protein